MVKTSQATVSPSVTYAGKEVRLKTFIKLMVYLSSISTILANGILYAINDVQLSPLVKIVSLIPVILAVMLAIWKYTNKLGWVHFLAYFLTSLTVTSFSIGFMMNDVLLNQVNYSIFHHMVSGNFSTVVIDISIIIYLINRITSNKIYSYHNPVEAKERS